MMHTGDQRRTCGSQVSPSTMRNWTQAWQQAPLPAKSSQCPTSQWLKKKKFPHIIWEFKSSCNVDLEENAIKDFPLWKSLNFSLIKEHLAPKLIKIRLKEPRVLARASSPSTQEAEAGLVYTASSRQQELHTFDSSFIWVLLPNKQTNKQKT